MDKDVLKTVVPGPLRNAGHAVGPGNAKTNQQQNGPATPRMWPPPPPPMNTAPYTPWVDPFDVVWHLWLRFLGSSAYHDAGTYQAFTAAEADAPKRIKADKDLSAEYLILKAGETPKPKYK